LNIFENQSIKCEHFFFVKAPLALRDLFDDNQGGDGQKEGSTEEQGEKGKGGGGIIIVREKGRRRKER
jgi:hypothetical protein